VNVCTSSTIHGQYEYIVPLHLPYFTSEAALLRRGFPSVDDLIEHLERQCNGRIEKSPAITAFRDQRMLAVRQQYASTTWPVRRSTELTSWRAVWDRLGEFRGRELSDPDRRIDEVLALWEQAIPDPWMRTDADIPARLLAGQRYTRGNLDGSRRGEHEIEYEILITYFYKTTYLGDALLDGVNAYPLVKNCNGGRNNDVEADLLLLVGGKEVAQIVVGEVKVGDGNAWTALVQNIRQVRLFTSSPACSSFFTSRGVRANIIGARGAVIAREMFYSEGRQKPNSLPYARRLTTFLWPQGRFESSLLKLFLHRSPDRRFPTGGSWPLATRQISYLKL